MNARTLEPLTPRTLEPYANPHAHVVSLSNLSTQAYIDYMRPRCVELARVLKKTGSFYDPARATGEHQPLWR